MQQRHVRVSADACSPLRWSGGRPSRRLLLLSSNSPNVGCPCRSKQRLSRLGQRLLLAHGAQARPAVGDKGSGLLAVSAALFWRRLLPPRLGRPRRLAMRLLARGGASRSVLLDGGWFSGTLWRTERAARVGGPFDALLQLSGTVTARRVGRGGSALEHQGEREPYEEDALRAVHGDADQRAAVALGGVGQDERVQQGGRDFPRRV